ncbi:hypothetical protein MHB42_15640 [Lysinibacillus sp. FSL K6-0232]|uniref:hypothetical protein n=1 Tax=unclassified Lysinibacillus TaxID=2636778 RepID=UPI0030F78532
MNEEKRLTDKELHHLSIALNAKAYGMKNIYKKSLTIGLIKREHDLNHTMGNKRNDKFQVFAFIETPEFIADLIELTTNKSQDQ